MLQMEKLDLKQLQQAYEGDVATSSGGPDIDRA